MVETVNDAQAAKEFLLQTPDAIDAFDQKYGQGSANAILNNTYSTPAELEASIAEREAAQNEPSGFLENATDMVQGVFAGAEAAINETAQTFNSLNMKLEEATGMGRIVWDDSDGDGKIDIIPSYWPREKVLENAHLLDQDVISKFVEEIDFVPDAQGTPGQVVQGIAQFVTGYATLSKATGIANGFWKALAKGAVVDATVFDPYEANLSATLQEFEWAKPYVVDALATDPSGSEWENRLRNSIEGGALGVGTDAVVKLVKFVALGRKAKQEISSIGRISDDTAAELDEVNDALLEISEEAQNAPKGLTARPDGNFQTPDGLVYAPEGETLQLVGLDIKPLDLPVGGPVSRLDAPRPAGDAPEVISTAIDGTDARTTIEAPTAPTVEAVAPKVPLIDADVFKQSLSRISDMSDFDLRSMEEGGWFNLERMEGPVEAAKVIDEFQNILSDTDVTKKMGIDTPETLQQTMEKSIKYVSEVTNTDANTLVRDLNITETVTRDLATKITAGRMALQHTGREVTKLAGKVDAAVNSGAGSEELERKLLETMQLHAELQANVKGIQTAAARATSAGRIATADTDLSNTLDSLSAFGGSEKLRTMAKQLKDITDDAATAKFVKKATERKFLGVLNEYWINQVLSGYKTHMLNMTSNGINLFLLPAERMAGGLYQGVTSGDYAQAKMAAKQYKYLVSSMYESIQLAAKTGWTEKPTLDNSLKVDINNGGKAISAENLGIKNRGLGATVNAIGKVFRLPSRFLMIEDELFKQLSFRARLKAMLEVDADGMTADELAQSGYSTKNEFFEAELEKALVSQTDALERYQELVAMGKIIDDAEIKEKFVEDAIGSYNKNSTYAVEALREARNTTYTNPLEKGTVSYSVQQLANRHPLLRQIIPFIQTPMNVMNAAFDRTPGLNLLRRQYVEALRSTDPAIRAEAQGKLATGTAIVSTLTFLAMDGRITGGGPTDAKKAAFWRNSKDWQPYSINVGSHEDPQWISTARLDPHTTLFGIIGDIAEMKAYVDSTPEVDASTLFAMTIAAVGNNVVSKTYMQGIADTVGILNSKDTPWKVDNFFAQKVASMVPFSSLQGQIGAATDEHLLEARGYIDAIKKRTLAFRDDLPVKHDWLTGEAMEGPDSLYLLPHIERKRLNPADKNVALVQSEIRKINYAPAGPDRKIGGVELTGVQYHRWNELMGTEKLGRKTLVERLAQRIQSKRYQAHDSTHGEFSVSEDPRVNELKVIIADYKTRARKKLLREFPELNEAVREYERYKKLARRGRQGERPVLDMNLR